MHVCLAIVVGSGSLVLSCAEARQTFISEERLDRIKASNDDIDSKVELETINKQRLV